MQGSPDGQKLDGMTQFKGNGICVFALYLFITAKGSLHLLG
jgi:hypothetical protein